jgi:mRNA interferase ChpB
MVRSDVPRCGDVYWIDPNPVAGREMKDRHRFVVITPRQVNALGVSMTVPITTGGAFARNAGLAVIVSGHETTGVAVCNQVGTVKLTGVLRRLEQRRRGLEHPRNPRSMGLFRRLVREAITKIAVESGGPNLKQKMGAPL